MPFSMTSSCILGFQATQLVNHQLGAILSIPCLLNDGKSQSISEENNSRLQTQQYPIRQVDGSPCRGDMNFIKSGEEEDKRVYGAAIVKPKSE